MKQYDTRRKAKRGPKQSNGSAREFPKPNPQGFTNGEIHSWYNFILGFSDKLVAKVMGRLNVRPGQLVLDPFCGTGTTLVESMKVGVASVGIDASPFSCFVSRVKASHQLRPEKLISALTKVRLAYERMRQKGFDYSHDPTYRYLTESGMIDRGWISKTPLADALTLKAAITSEAPSAIYRDALLLALVARLSRDIANMKFGPEIYRGRKKRTVNVWNIFENQVGSMVKDLCLVKEDKLKRARVFKGDARRCDAILRGHGIKKIDVAISSPPYPTEHDYTRNTRLELAFLNFVSTNDCVRKIKKHMIRSNTKNIYKTDQDAEFVRGDAKIDALAERVARRRGDDTSGFARLYPTVIRQYFGGMKRHFESMSAIMRRDGRYAIVVGDQASYFGIHVPTAALLGRVAEQCGFVVEESFVWRKRWATKTSRLMKEHALILRKV